MLLGIDDRPARRDSVGAAGHGGPRRRDRRAAGGDPRDRGGGRGPGSRVRGRSRPASRAAASAWSPLRVFSLVLGAQVLARSGDLLAPTSVEVIAVVGWAAVAAGAILLLADRRGPLAAALAGAAAFALGPGFTIATATALAVPALALLVADEARAGDAKPRLRDCWPRSRLLLPLAWDFERGLFLLLGAAAIAGPRWLRWISGLAALIAFFAPGADRLAGLDGPAVAPSSPAHRRERAADRGRLVALRSHQGGDAIRGDLSRSRDRGTDSRSRRARAARGAGRRDPRAARGPWRRRCKRPGAASSRSRSRSSRPTRGCARTRSTTPRRCSGWATDGARRSRPSSCSPLPRSVCVLHARGRSGADTPLARRARGRRRGAARARDPARRGDLGGSSGDRGEPDRARAGRPRRAVAELERAARDAGRRSPRSCSTRRCRTRRRSPTGTVIAEVRLTTRERHRRRSRCAPASTPASGRRGGPTSRRSPASPRPRPYLHWVDSGRTLLRPALPRAPAPRCADRARRRSRCASRPALPSDLVLTLFHLELQR